MSTPQTDPEAVRKKVIECLRLMASDNFTAGIVMSYLDDGMRDEWDCSLPQGLEAGFGGQELKIAAKTALAIAEYHEEERHNNP